MPVVKQSFRHCESGSSAAEFALVLPVFLLFLLGIIDVGRYVWTLNTAEKATQMGARAAVVSNFVATGLSSKEFGAVLGQGATIPLAQFDKVVCSKSGSTVSCSCPTGHTDPPVCSTLGTPDSTTFNAIVTRMRTIAPAIAEGNVSIGYSNSGLGYAGDPNGADVAPLVTVSVNSLAFTPLIFQFLGASFSMPTITASLTMEDGQGAVENAN